MLAARTLFVETCIKLIKLGEATNQALASKLMMADLKEVHKLLEHTVADPLTAPEAAKMAESIRAVFNTNAQALRFLPEGKEAFSISDWIRAENKPGSILFITSSHNELVLNRALLSLWMNLAVHTLMRLPRTRDLRTWFFFDEVHALHRLPAIEDGLQTIPSPSWPRPTARKARRTLPRSRGPSSFSPQPIATPPSTARTISGTVKSG